MTRERELDLLAEDTQRQLADCVVAVYARRPAGTLDVETRRRLIDLDEPTATVPAIREEMPAAEHERVHVRRRLYRVLVADLGFRPSRESLLQDDGLWAVHRVDLAIDGREYEITCERLA